MNLELLFVRATTPTITQPNAMPILSNSAPTALETKFQASPDVLSAELGTDISLLHPRTGVYFTLNPLAAKIWKQLQTPATFSGLKAFVLANYIVSESQCEQDLRRILNQLVSERLVESLD